jgi:hypothetical protein
MYSKQKNPSSGVTLHRQVHRGHLPTMHALGLALEHEAPSPHSTYAIRFADRPMHLEQSAAPVRWPGQSSPAFAAQTARWQNSRARLNSHPSRVAAGPVRSNAIEPRHAKRDEVHSVRTVWQPRQTQSTSLMLNRPLAWARLAPCRSPACGGLAGLCGSAARRRSALFLADHHLRPPLWTYPFSARPR